MYIFDTLIINPITNALLFIYYFINSLNVPFALGFSIIVLTIFIRLILYPLTTAQIKASKKMMELNPLLAKLKEKYKNDSKALQQETMRLYKENGVNPAAGCLPILVQLPVIWGLYTVLMKVISVGASNLAQVNNLAYADFMKLTRVWDINFFGISLAQNPSQLISSMGPLILIVPIGTGLLQFVQSKMMVVPVKKEDKKLNPKDNEKKKDDFASAMQTQMTYLLPIMIGFFSYTFPIGLSLYWNTFTVFGIIQQYKTAGLGGLKEWVEKYNGRK